MSNSVMASLAGSQKEHHLRVKAYQGMEAPFGLAEAIANETSSIALRIFLLDNSGSTCLEDGHVLRKGQSQRLESQPATRWEEIVDIALDQAEWNARGAVRSEFLLLNPPCPDDPKPGRDFLVVDPKHGDSKSQVDALTAMLHATEPCGPTPLGQRLRQLRLRLKDEVTDGRRIMLTIVTDGVPTAPGYERDEPARDRADFVRELREFTTSFNAFAVVRLATDEASVVDCYNHIDEELELPLDILDDLKGEADEVHASGNGWFAYSPLIHRVREGGSLEKLFDLLDERPLELPEIARFLEFLLRGPDDGPFPRTAKELFEVAQVYASAAPEVFNGRLGRMTSPLDLRLLQKALFQTSAKPSRGLATRMLRILTCSKQLPA